MTAGYKEFEFDLPDALLASIVEAFDSMEGAPLTEESFAGVPEAQGVYQLLIGSEIVYIGKTDAVAGLRKRLSRHGWSIQHRHGLEEGQVMFKALRVYVFTAMDIESQLIAHYKRANSIAWNDSGFGSNDPGRNRDDTRAKEGGFDVLYPIDVDRAIKLDKSGQVKVSEALVLLRRALPYTLRAEQSGNHPDLVNTEVVLPDEATTVRSLLTRFVDALPLGWQATRLAGRVILYKENKGYTAGLILAQRA